MKVFQVNAAKQAFVDSARFKTHLCKRATYLSNGFVDSRDIVKIEKYIPIVNLLEKECNIKIKEIIDIDDVTFETLDDVM